MQKIVSYHEIHIFLFQTLCILANVADGDQAKEYIMSNEDVLKKLMNYMVNSPTSCRMLDFEIKVKSMQRSGTEAIRTEIQP